MAQQGTANSLDAIFVATIALYIGALLSCLGAHLHLPYSVLLLLFGLAFGIGGETYVKSWAYLGPGIFSIEEVGPELLALLFLPPLLFAGGFGLTSEALIQSWSHIVLLGIIGVGSGTCMTGVLTYYILPYQWSWTQAFLFGAIAAATDPVSAIAVLKEVQAPEEVQVVVDGEALVDDGVAAVLFAVFRIFVRGQKASPGDVIKLLCRQSLAGPATGLAFGVCAFLWLLIAPKDANTWAVILIVSAFGSYFVSEEIFKSSGILATVALGMMMTITSDKMLRIKLKETVHEIWSAIEYIANTIVFVVCGIIIAGRIYQMHQIGSAWNPTPSAYGYAVAVWLLLLVVRVVNILVFWPILIRTGHGFSFALAVLTAWSGIRGVVGLVLALSVLLDPFITDEPFKEQAFFFLSTTLVLTVVVQGSTYAAVAKFVGLRGSQGVTTCIQASGNPPNSLGLPQ